MSIIYDALKKLDREKSSRLGRTDNIAAEILKPDFFYPRKKVSLYITVAFFTAMVTVAVTYAVLAKWRFETKPSSAKVVNPAVASPSSNSNVLSQSSPPETGQPIASDLPSHESAPDIQGKTNPVSSTPKMRNSAIKKKDATPPVENKEKNRKEDQSVIPKETGPVPEKGKIPSKNGPAGPTSPMAHPASSETLQGGPVLTTSPLNISAVIWYEEPSKRFAMINGRIVREGAVVEGMKVEEIFPNRVRFLHNDQYVEIPVQ